MRGIKSEGMVLSAKELGLGEDHDGIQLLNPKLPVGALLREVLGETILALDVQPNRPDCLGIVGVAREVAALLATALREAALDPLTTRTPEGLDVRIEDPEACPRFAAALLRNVRIGPSPAWLQGRLVAAGMRPIDNVVDITNYVMLELGQPLHAYDHRELHGGALVARRARPGAALRTLVGVVDRYPRPRARVNVRMRFSDVPRVMGIEISPEETLDILRRLQFEAAADRDTLVATPPAVRTDIAIAEDVVEEVGRLAGYDRLPMRIPDGPLPLHERHPLEEFRERARDGLAGFGLQEIVAYSLIDPAWLSQLTADGSPLAPEPLRVTNPTSLAQSVARPTLRPSLLDTARRNPRNREGIAIFEIAPVYLPRRGALPEERWTIGILLAGNAEPARDGETWLTKPRPWDIRDLEGFFDALAELLHVSHPPAEPASAPGLHPGRSIAVAHDGAIRLAAGQLDPRVAERWELPLATFVGEIDLAWWHAASRRPEAKAPPRYPPALRDLAIVVDEATPYRHVVREIHAAAPELLESASLLDLYRGPQAGPGKKSFAFRLVFRSATGTLSEGDVERAMKRVVGRLEHALGAAIRS